MSAPELTEHEELAALCADLREAIEWERVAGALYIEGEPPVERQDPIRRAASDGAAQARHSRLPHNHAERTSDTQSILQRQPTSAPDGKTTESLASIRQELGNCQRCALSQSRQSIVFGVGPETVDVVVIGEAPGRNEDITGEPFVGRAGKLLNRMLKSIGLARDTVYICNVIKCRPPQNRDPEAVEIATCSPFLHRQLRVLKPKVIVTVGRFASQNIVGSEASMGELRKEIRSMNGIPVVPTYHPAYLLRNPAMKRAAWEDLCKVRVLVDKAT